jgi:hypothetical protein
MIPVRSVTLTVPIYLQATWHIVADPNSAQDTYGNGQFKVSAASCSGVLPFSNIQQYQ